jgi:hypothetical protein
MYGPPPDPRQVPVGVAIFDAPELYLACFAIGIAVLLIGLRMKRLPQAARAFLIILGWVLGLTAPLAVCLNDVVYGAWPTIDKAGSFLFYADGVHRRLLLHPIESLHDPAVQLIGVHLGHLWITEFFDLFLNPHGAFNVQGILYPTLGWFCAWLFLRELGSHPRVAFVFAMPFGMGLHVFRDLNWYTIEKAAVFGIPLFLWTLVKARAGGRRWLWAVGIVLLLCAWLNWYLFLVNGAILALYALCSRDRSALEALAAAFVAVLPLIIYQSFLLQDAGALSDPTRFLAERAALDTFSFFPPAWNRLEAHRALNLVGLGLGIVGVWRNRSQPRIQLALLLVVVLTTLATGPYWWGDAETGVPNPIYHGALTAIPGFWRIAKPEFFFEGAWLIILAIAAQTFSHRNPTHRDMRWVFTLFIAAWLFSVRGHPAYPDLHQPVEVELSDDWADRVFVQPS